MPFSLSAEALKEKTGSKSLVGYIIYCHGKVVAKFHTYHMVSFKDRPPPLISERIMTEPVLNIPELLKPSLL